MLILDTHIWVWWLTENSRLKDEAISFLNEKAKKDEIVISIMNVWELEILVRKEKLYLNTTFEKWVQKSVSLQTFQIIPLTLPIILGQKLLPKNFHEDPADKLITSTAIVSGYELATLDRRIIQSKACKIWSQG